MFLMRRKIISTIIALTLCLSSAFAATPISTDVLSTNVNTKTNDVSLIQIDKADLNTPKISLSKAPILISEAENDEKNADNSAPTSTQSVNAIITQDYLVEDITVRPIFQSSADGETYYINYETLYKQIRRWVDNQPRFESLTLTREETADFYNEIDAIAIAASANDGVTYKFYGWDFTTNVIVQAENPLYIKYTPDPNEDCINENGEQTMTIPYQSTRATIHLMFKSSTDDRDTLQSYGCNGGFYFRYPSGPNVGKIGSLMVSPNFATNRE
jgi:hypothetical protein